MSNNLIFRAATNRDTEMIIDLVRRILLEFKLPYDPETSDKDLVNIEDTYINNGGSFVVIEDAGLSIIGTVALQKVSDATGKLRKMYVDKNFRGMGLGEQLLELILEKALVLNFQEITLETVHTMTAAIQLYQKYGFRKVDGFIPTSPRCDMVMRKELV